MEKFNQEQKTAIALTYDSKHGDAPRVVATGKGYVADQMIRIANEENIPLHKDENLANALSSVRLGEEIPPELYEIVAQVLIYVDRLDGIFGKDKE